MRAKTDLPYVTAPALFAYQVYSHRHDPLDKEANHHVSSFPTAKRIVILDKSSVSVQILSIQKNYTNLIRHLIMQVVYARL